MIPWSADQCFNFFPVPTDIHFGFGVVVFARGTCAFVWLQTGVLQLRIPGSFGRTSRLCPHPFLGSRNWLRCVRRGQPDSGSGLIVKATQRLMGSQAGVVVGIGGGSSLDTAKAVAMLATNPGSLFSYAGLHRVKNRSATRDCRADHRGDRQRSQPLVCVTNDDTGLKVAIGSFHLYPTVCALRPRANPRSSSGAHGCNRHGCAGSRH